MGIDIKINTKKFFRLETARVVAHKALYRFLLGLVFLMLWNMLVNKNNYYSIFELGFFTLGVFFLGFAWKNYLQLDGIRLYGFEDMKIFKRKKKDNPNKSMVDFVDEDTPQFDNLSDEEEKIACFFGNLFAGSVYMIISIIYICFFR